MDKEFRQLLEDFKYYNSKGNSDRAKIILDELKQKYFNDVRVTFSEALYYYRLGTYNDRLHALDILKELIDMDAKNKEAAMYEYIRMISYMGVQSSEIDNYYRYLIKIKYKVEYVYFYYGRYLEGQKNFEDAIQMYEISSKLGFHKAKERLSNLNYKNDIDNNEIDDVASHDNKNLFDLKLSVEQLFNECRYDEIRTILNDYESKYGIMDNFSILYYIFKSYIAIGYLEDARNIYKNNLKYINDDFLKIFLEARLNLCDEKYDEAAIKLKKVISYEKDFMPTSYYYLAQIANISKHHELEREYLIKMQEVSRTTDYVYMKLIGLDICEYKYEDAKYKLYQLSDKFKKEYETDINQIRAIINLDASEEQMYFYSVNQIFDYDEDATFQHIQKHLDGDYRNSLFNPNIDLVKLIDYIRDIIIDREIDFHDIFSHYIIDYPNIGQCNNRSVNYIEVVAIPHTNKIITMFPIASKNIFIPNKVEEGPVKIKRKSQIDKFYERYGK